MQEQPLSGSPLSICSLGRQKMVMSLRRGSQRLTSLHPLSWPRFKWISMQLQLLQRRRRVCHIHQADQACAGLGKQTC